MALCPREQYVQTWSVHRYAENLAPEGRCQREAAQPAQVIVDFAKTQRVAIECRAGSR